jgi:hypothetical protein
VQRDLINARKRFLPGICLIVRALLPWQRRASFRLPRKNPHYKAVFITAINRHFPAIRIKRVLCY